MTTTTNQAYLPGFEPIDLFGGFEPLAAQACLPTAIQQPQLLDDGAPVPDIVAAFPAVGPAPSQSEIVLASAPADDNTPSTMTTTPALTGGDHLLTNIIDAPVLSALTAATTGGWQELTADRFDGLASAKAKFSANMEAIGVLRSMVQGAALTDDSRLTLSRFSGWGAMADLFTTDYDWRNQRESFKSVLSDAELKAARDGCLYSHYTPLWLIKAIWSAVRSMGFTGGRVLDPCTGTGLFMGGAPSDIASSSAWAACELDPIAGRITKALYGHAAAVHLGGYEAAPFMANSFDLAISNVPFGNFSVACTKRRAYSNWSIHNYFLAQMLDHVREGGLVVAITSTGFLDASTSSHRTWLRNRAKLLGAIRLPSGTFTASANTGAAADLVFLQKRGTADAIGADEATWNERGLAPANISGHLIESQRYVNSYFLEHPEMGAGTWEPIRAQYGFSIGVVAAPEAIADHVASCLSRLPKDVYESANLSRVLDVRTRTDSGSDLQPGSYFVEFNEVFINEGYGKRSAGLTGSRADRVTRLVRLRDCLRKLLRLQADGASTDAQRNLARSQLNAIYDAYVSKHGYIMERGSRLAFRSDPDWPLLLSLEHWDEDEQKAYKTDIFSRDTGAVRSSPISAETVEDAIALSVAELGTLSPTYVARLLGEVDTDEVMAKAMASGHAFVNPETGHYEEASAYLSGDIREKLRAASGMGAQFTRNVEALTAVVPQDLPPGDIDVRLGSHWVPVDDYAEFIASLAPQGAALTRGDVKLECNASSGAWSLDLGYRGRELNTAWGTTDIEAVAILSSSFNGRPVSVYDTVHTDDGPKQVLNVINTAAAREKQEAISVAFQNWIWADTSRTQRLMRIYNDSFNSWVERKFDGSRLRLPGYSWFLNPSPHQVNAVMCGMTGGNLLLGHCVGAGKSLTMQMTSMELRRLGIRRKPAHVVPNHMLDQYCSEFMRAYPNARLLMISKDDLTLEKRKEFVAKVATGDWDAVVFTHSSFERVSAPAGLSKRIMEETIAEMDVLLSTTQRSAATRTIVKQAAKAKKEWEARLAKLGAVWKRDDFVSLDQLGIDHLFVDEAHYFKNLFRLSQMPNVAGLSNSSSQRAFDMLIKTRAIMAMHGDKQAGVVFATGTFVANSLAEMHVMQRYLQPKTLARIGLDGFDAWAKMFGRVVTSLEISPDGSSFRMNERFAQFVNVPELMSLFGEVADIKTKQMLQLPTPSLFGGSAQVIAVDASAALKKYVESLVERASRLKKERVDPKTDNMLKVTGDGRKAALDMRLVDPTQPFDRDSKIGAMVDKAHALWVESAGFKGAQVIFCDLATPSGKGLSVYPTIRELLIEKGVPAAEIALIHDAKTDTAKAALFARVRAGLVRFLLGSTLKMGVGTNVQTVLYALHHLDAPWRPADVEQREGRIERRGNTCEFIHIYRYVTSGSFDAYMWQTLAAKAGFIGQVMSGDRTLRRVEDANMAALSYEEVKAIACGNPKVREKALLDNEMRKLSMLASHHRRTRSNAQYELQNLGSRAKLYRDDLANIEADEVTWSGSASSLSMRDRTYTGEALHEALRIAVERWSGSLVETLKGDASLTYGHIGAYRGLNIAAAYRQSQQANVNGLVIIIGNRWRQAVYPYQRGVQLQAALDEALQKRSKDMAVIKESLESLLRQGPLLQELSQAPFAQEARMREIASQLEALEAELGLNAATTGTAAMDESTAAPTGESDVVESEMDEAADECV